MATDAECYDCGCRAFMIPVCGNPMASCAYTNAQKSFSGTKMDTTAGKITSSAACLTPESASVPEQSGTPDGA